MLLQLDFESEIPIYQQLVNAIIEGIATRELQSGEALPSVRALASDIGVNMHTVNKAYQILKNDGFLLIHRQKGVVVNPESPKFDPPFMEKLNGSLKTLINEAICRGMELNDFMDQCQSLYKNTMDQRGARK